MPLHASSAHSSALPEEIWVTAFNELGQRIKHAFVRPESYQHALAYMQGFDLAREDWQELSAGMGSKGPRLFAWARIELAAPESSGWQRWLLVRRNLEEGVKPAEMAYILVFAPTGTSLENMVEAFGARWTVE